MLKFINVWSDLAVNLIRILDPGVLIIGGIISEKTQYIFNLIKGNIRLVIREDVVAKAEMEILVANDQYNISNAVSKMFIGHAFNKIYENF